ncbi:zinc-dependent alcohol dehydrogenase [Candidatus Entotheonella palauensis]|uniref:zinc-dependent alcohol dehydrogenase n=1 Tax=Candidatus Entotheonella palauensis TaxID=93172 RepID=UPI000B7E0F8B|nr:alcohol dehydrogenase catalytic domain-containing protein [Candidatus Entotheonella palauensis]
MQAAVLRGAEQVSIEEVPRPPIGPGDVLVRVEAATTCGTDLKVFLRGGHPRMITVPSVFGHEFSGTIVAVGSTVTGFEKGMRVVANNSAPCYQCVECRRNLPNLCDDLLFINGTYAEYMRVPERVVRTNLLVVPDDIPAAVAAMTEPLACVLNGLDVVRFGPGDTVVVNGDGPSGLMMAAMAKQRGARVIVCGRAPQRLTLAGQFGADVVINYAAVPDQVEAVRAHTEGRRGVDVAIEAVGRPEVWEASVAMARKGGQVLFYGGCPGDSVVQLPTGPLHYEQLTLLGVFHNTPYHVRLALSLLNEKTWPWASLITHELPLSKLHEAFELMVSRKALKVAVLP